MQESGTATTASEPVGIPKARWLRIAIVAILLVLTVQGWTGDAVNIFVAPASGVTPPSQDLGGFFGAVQSLGPFLIWHAIEGIIVLAMAIALLVLAFRWSKDRGVRVCAILATFFVLAAAYGGYGFVLSGFQAGPSSATMGGSFIGSYAFYFMTLYYAK